MSLDRIVPNSCVILACPCMGWVVSAMIFCSICSSLQDPAYLLDLKQLGVQHLEHDPRSAIAAFVGAAVIGTSGLDNACLFQGIDIGLAQFEDPFSSSTFHPFSRNECEDAWSLSETMCIDALHGDLATGLPKSVFIKVRYPFLMHVGWCMVSFCLCRFAVLAACVLACYLTCSMVFLSLDSIVGARLGLLRVRAGAWVSSMIGGLKLCSMSARLITFAWCVCSFRSTALFPMFRFSYLRYYLDLLVFWPEIRHFLLCFCADLPVWGGPSLLSIFILYPLRWCPEQLTLPTTFSLGFMITLKQLLAIALSMLTEAHVYIDSRLLLAVLVSKIRFGVQNSFSATLFLCSYCRCSAFQLLCNLLVYVIDCFSFALHLCRSYPRSMNVQLLTAMPFIFSQPCFQTSPSVFSLLSVTMMVLPP